MISTAYDHLKSPPSLESKGTAPTVIEIMLAVIRVWSERYRSRSLLAGLSERELRDMGVCRAEIANEIGKPFWQA